MGIFTNLTKNQREAVGLLQIGTFLEYFDLMLYVHMAVLLNDIFFPKTDPHTARIISAFAFSTTFVFRPLGALLFGYLGDTIGRKSTVILTTFLMAVSCFIMSLLPTYEQIGIAATWLVTICRILQGISSMGERTGAELYLTETTKVPARYPIVALITVTSSIGGTVALAISYLVTSANYALGWRIAFWIGTGVALIGSVARTTLRETPEFADAKRRLKQKIQEANEDANIIEKSIIWGKKISTKTSLSLFLIQCTWPVCMYFFYVHCGSILKTSFNFTSEQVIHQNFLVSIGQLLSDIIVAYLCYKIYPLKILKAKLILFIVFILVCPYILHNIRSPHELLLVQIFAVAFVPTVYPATPIFYMHFPVFKRFTYPCLVHSLSRAFMYVLVSFGIAYLVEWFNHFSIIIIMLPIIIGYTFGVLHFEKLEVEADNYPQRRKQAFPRRLTPLG